MAGAVATSRRGLASQAPAGGHSRRRLPPCRLAAKAQARNNGANDEAAARFGERVGDRHGWSRIHPTRDESFDGSWKFALANTTEFGLGGIVFGADEQEALAVADRMDTGSVGVNFFASNHAAPFGGRHDSGLGTEYGIEGLNAYVSYKSIHRRA